MAACTACSASYLQVGELLLPKMLPGEQAVPRVPCTCSQPSKMRWDQVLVGFAELSQHLSAPEEHREAAAVSCCCFPVASGLFLRLCQPGVGCVWSKAPPCSFSILLHQICICLPEYPGNSGLGNPHRNPPFSPSSQNIKPRTKKMQLLVPVRQRAMLLGVL